MQSIDSPQKITAEDEVNVEEVVTADASQRKFRSKSSLNDYSLLLDDKKVTSESTISS